MLGFTCLASSVERVVLPDHASASQIAYIRFSRDSIRHDFDHDVDALCHAIHAKKSHEHHASDLAFECVSSLESSGLLLVAERVDCAEDVSESDLAVFVNPIRLDGCTLTPRVVPLPADYEDTRLAYMARNEWICHHVNCTELDITLYEMVKHAVDVLQIVPSEHFKCGPQVCYVEDASSFAFYSKLFLLLWRGK